MTEDDFADLRLVVSTSDDEGAIDVGKVKTSTAGNPRHPDITFRKKSTSSRNYRRRSTSPVGSRSRQGCSNRSRTRSPFPPRRMSKPSSTEGSKYSCRPGPNLRMGFSSSRKYRSRSRSPVRSYRRQRSSNISRGIPSSKTKFLEVSYRSPGRSSGKKQSYESCKHKSTTRKCYSRLPSQLQAAKSSLLTADLDLEHSNSKMLQEIRVKTDMKRNGIGIGQSGVGSRKKSDEHQEGQYEGARYQ